MKTIINKQANFKYTITEKFEAGIVLMGWEVKSLISNGASLENTFVYIKDGEAYLDNLSLKVDSKVDRFSIKNKDRKKKLLLHKTEINKLIGKVEQKGFTIIPLKIYDKGKKLKVEICLAKGKSEYDKRNSVKTRELELESKMFLKNKIKNL